MAEYNSKGRQIYNTNGVSLDAMDSVWINETAFEAFFRNEIGLNTIPAGTRIRTYFNGKYTEKFWNGEAWKEIAAESGAFKDHEQRLSEIEDETLPNIEESLKNLGDGLKELNDNNAKNAYKLAEEAKDKAQDAEDEVARHSGLIDAAKSAATAAGTAAAAADSKADAAKTAANQANLTLMGHTTDIAEAKRMATAAQTAADAAGTVAQRAEGKADVLAGVMEGHTAKLATLKPITEEDMSFVPAGNGLDLKARGEVLATIPMVDEVDAGLMTPAMLATLNNLVGLDGTRFGGFSINDDPDLAVGNIVNLFDDYGLTSGEAYWFLAGRGIESLRAYRYDGNGGSEPQLISDKAYDLTDFSGVKEEIEGVKSELGELGPKLDDINSHFLIENPIELSGLQDHWYINTTSKEWYHKATTVCSSYLIPAENYIGKTIKVTANDNKISRIALIKNANRENNSVPVFCSGFDFDTDSQIAIGQSKEFVIPFDCTYIYVYREYGGSFYEPKSIAQIENKNIPQVDETLTEKGSAADANSTGNAIQAIKNSFAEFTTRKKVNLAQYEDIDYIILSSGETWNKTPSYKHKVIPCKSGDKFEFLANDTAICAYAWLRTDNYGSGAIPDFADGTTVTIIQQGESSGILIAPSDANYLYINSKGGGSSSSGVIYLPKEFYKLVPGVDNSEPIEYPLSLFHKVAVIGASWDSGYFSTNGTNRFESHSHSWLANAARRNGVEYHCFARRSAWTRVWLNDAAFKPYCIDAMQEGTACDLYIISLNGNDANNGGMSYLGSPSDINDDDYNLNADTYYGNYAKIIQLIKQKSPYARIVCIYSTRTNDAVRDAFRSAVDYIADKYGLPVISWNDDDWYNDNMTDSSLLIGDHPTTMQLGGVSMSFERLLSKCIATHYDYFNKWYNHSADDVEIMRT